MIFTRLLAIAALLIATLPPLSAAAAGVPGERRPVFNVRSYGALGTGKSVETAALQRAIDARHAGAGGGVVVPPGLYTTGTLRLRSHMTLRLERGAVLQGSLDLADYATDIRGAIEAPAFDGCLIYAEDSRDITLEGAGEIDGRGSRANFPAWARGKIAARPMLLRFVNCEQVTVSGLKFRNPASWGLFVRHADGLVLRNVRIERPAQDVRAPYVFSDVTGLKTEGFVIDGRAVETPRPGKSPGSRHEG